MKRTVYFFAAGMSAVLMAACQKTAEPYIEVGKENYEVTNAYTELNIPVKCNVESRAEVRYDGEETDWIFLLPSVLDGDGVYSLWIDEYANVLEDRTATLVFTAGTVEKEVGIIQLSKNSIGISPMVLASTASSGSYPVEISCRREWSIVPEKDTEGWLSLDKTSGEGVSTVNVTLSALQGDSEVKTGHLKFTSGDLEVEMTVQHGYAQEIDGLIWSKANVDEPGMFGESPDTRGKLYQYDSKTAWPNSSPETSGCPDGMRVGQFDSGVSDWSAENDPCPAGWRVPSIEEIRQLAGDSADKKFYWLEPAVSGFDVPGIIIGIPADEAATATADNMKGAIFLPQTGSRNKDTGNQDNWWSASMTSRTRPGQNWDRYVFWADYSQSFDYNGFDGNAAAYPVRCVADKPDGQ